MWNVRNILARLMVILAMPSALSHAETSIFWDHDDSVATIRLGAGQKGSDSFELLSDMSELNKQGPTLKKVHTQDEKLNIYCVGLQDHSQESTQVEASCNVEMNFFKTQPESAKNTPKTLIVHNPQDAQMLWEMFSEGTDKDSYTYKSEKGEFCIQCAKQGFSSPKCVVSILNAGDSCGSSDAHLKRASMETNTFVD